MKPPGLGPEYGAQFQDDCVAAAYPCRPPYPPDLLDLLASLALDEPRRVLDVGAGTGDLARPLAARFERVDAVDLSPAMVARGRALPGGDDARLHWHVGPAEAPPPAAPYGLVTAGESLHWMDWTRIFATVRDALAPGAFLVLVGRVEHAPWESGLRQIVPRFSTNRDFAPYDLLAEVVRAGLFEHEGTHRTATAPFRQTVDAYVESLHSRNGFSRARMGPDGAAAFDAELGTLLADSAVDGTVLFEVGAVAHWGRPLAK